MPSKRFRSGSKSSKTKGELADEAAAYSVLRSVLHQLRDRLTLEEGVDLGAQLPLIVRGLYYDGWRPHRVPRKLTKEKFLDELSKDILPHTYPVEWAVSTVFALIASPLRKTVVPMDFVSARILSDGQS